MVSPKLRFSNFSGPWRQELLANLVRYTKGFAFKSDDYRSVGVRIIRVSDLSARDIKHNGESIFIDEKCLDSYEQYKIKKDEIIITTVGSKPDLVDSAVGRGIFVTEENPGLLNQNMLKINGLDGILNKFLFGQINTERYIVHIKSIQRGNANQSNITVKELLSFPIFITSFEEQTKIAYFLTSVDEKITLQTKQYDLLCQYKKGMMQKIFSQEVQFKDENGEEFPEWELKQLSEIAIINPKNKVIPSEFIYIDLESVENGILLKEQLISKNDAPSRAQRLLAPGDVLFQLVRPYQKNNYIFLLDGDYVASTGYAQLRANYNSLFLYQLLHLESFTSEVMNRCTGTSYPAINSSDLASIEVEIPCEKEQTKIANFLSALDDKIAVKKAELDKLKTWKQGLLQQMFI